MSSLTLARVWFLWCCSLPWSVPVVRQARPTIISSSAVLTQADHPTVWLLWVAWYAHIGVTITLATTSHNKVSDSIVVRLQDFRITKHFISKGVQTHQRHSLSKKTNWIMKYTRFQRGIPDIGSWYPILKFSVVVEVVSTRSTIQSSKSHISTRKWRDVGKLWGTECSVFADLLCILSVAFIHWLNDWKWFRDSICVSAGSRVILPGDPSVFWIRIWLPWLITDLLIDCKTLWSRRAEFQPNIGDVKGLPWNNW